jgi:hypothetical protein
MHAEATERQQFTLVSPTPFTASPSADFSRHVHLRVKNIGTETWSRDLGQSSRQVLLSYRWYKADGVTLAQPLDPQRVSLPVPTVLPNATVDFQDFPIAQRAPAAVGTYILKWDLVYIRLSPLGEVAFDDPLNPGGPTPPGEQVVNIQLPQAPCVHPWQCNQAAAGEALAAAFAPRIDFAICFPGPGGLCGISGTRFGTQPGRLHATFVTYDGQPLPVDLSVSSWQDDFIQATLADSISGVLDQTWTLRVITAELRESNAWSFFTFRPTEELTMVSSASGTVGNVVVRCDNSSWVADCFVNNQPPPTFFAFHGPGPGQIWVTGQDHYEVNNLPFGCTLDHLDAVGPVTFSGFNRGSSSAHVNVNWSVGLGGNADYHLTFWAIGPRGVPCQP